MIREKKFIQRLFFLFNDDKYRPIDIINAWIGIHNG